MIFSLKKALPFCLCLLIVLLSQMKGSRFIFPSLIFIPIFYFAIFRPTLLNTIPVFVLGLLTDLINRTPLGLFSFIFVLLFFVSRLNRLFLKELSFKSLWIFFSACSGVLLLIELFLFTLSESSVVQTKFLFQQITVLVLVYPLGFSLSNRLNEWIGDQE